MFIAPLAEAKVGRSFARISPRPNIAKPVPSSAPAVHSNGTTAAQAPTSQIQPPAALTTATSSSAPALVAETKPVAVTQLATVTPSMPQSKAGAPVQTLAPVPSQLLAIAPTTLQSAAPVASRPAPLTVASPVYGSKSTTTYNSRSTTTKVSESSTMQNIAVGVLGGLGIAMLADSLFGDDEAQSANQSANATTADASNSSSSSFASLLFTAGLVVVFLGLLWFTVSEYIRHRRRVR